MDAALRGLRAALASMPQPLAFPLLLEPLPDTGLAHDHIRWVGSPWMARLPKQSQMGLPPAENLAYQAACFERAAASGHTPRLEAVLSPGPALPRGGLLVQAIEGRPADAGREDDLRAIAQALASMHALPVPDAALRPPLLDPPSPLAALCVEVQIQAGYLARAGLEPATLQRLNEAIDAFARDPALAAPGRCLVAFDAHPGNFLIEADGRAVLVDLEKARYGHPGCDLAHATLYTSTTWPVTGGVALEGADVQRACVAWARRLGPTAARAWWPTLALARLGMALWAFTWCAKWRVLSAGPEALSSAGEDWSAERSEPELIRHVRGRVDHYLEPGVVADVLDGCAALARALALQGPPDA